MNLQQSDIRPFLLESIPFRFNALSPPEFLEFIGHLFAADGYQVGPAHQEGEFSNLIIARKEAASLIIQAYRYEPDVVVTEDEINTAVHAKSFYNTHQCWIVTTSAFTKEARKIAEKEDIELWDWDALYLAICQLYFGGKNHLEYLEAHPFALVTPESETELKLKAKWAAAEGIGTEWFNLGITVSNPSDRNIYLHLELPALIDNRRNQVMADQWVDGEFVSGMIYAGASIRTNALFSVAKLGDRPSGGRIVLTCHERKEIPVTYHLNARLKGEACFIVTYCYTRQSEEYAAMILYRDGVLSKSLVGQSLIRIYYLISPHLVRYASKIGILDLLLRKFATFLVPILIGKMKK